jgi:acyl-coenzyme A thioesterase PaaI-like protein
MLLKEAIQFRQLGFRIPVLLLLGPKVVRLDERGAVVQIKYGWRSRNHVGSMYVGALCAGADLAAGLPAARLMWSTHPGVIPIFKDLRAEFLKRADGDVLFTCDEGPAVSAAVEQAFSTGERVTLPVNVTCTVPDKYGAEPVARFTMGLSLKRRAEGRAP